MPTVYHQTITRGHLPFYLHFLLAMRRGGRGVVPLARIHAAMAELHASDPNRKKAQPVVRRWIIEAVEEVAMRGRIAVEMGV